MINAAAAVHCRAWDCGGVADRGAGTAGGMPVIGFIHPFDYYRTGYVESQDVAVEYRCGENGSTSCRRWCAIG
jgi:hypothetical protein